MTENRFPDTETSNPPAGFLLIAVAGAPAPAMTPLQLVYQRIYEQAMQANQPKLRDLFAIMN